VSSAEDMAEHELAKAEKMLEEYELYYDFDSIPDISSAKAEEYQSKIFNSMATQYEKTTLRKYLFVRKFKTEYRTHELVAYGWNKQKMKLTDAIQARSKLFADIAELNGFSGLPKDLTKVKLTDELLDKIFATFTFRSLTKKSKLTKILFNVYTDFFGDVYKSVQLTQGHFTYMRSEPDAAYVEFAAEALRTNL
jgi:hypothetical protein